MPDFYSAPTHRAAIYARVSSEEQREGKTIDSQIAELERFAHEKGWPVVGVYRDEGWSGALLSRPALDQLRDDAAQKKFDLVLLNDVDRLARDVAHLGIVKRDFERRGVRVVFRKLPQEESPTYNLMVNVLGSFAEFEREMIADRTRRGRRHKVEVRQQFLGTLASFGYRYVPKDKASGKDGYLTVVPEEAGIVRQMYEWVDKEALSARKVTERLNRLKVRPRKAGSWAKTTVLHILRNETYAGVWHYNKHYSSEPLRPAARTKYRRSVRNSCRLRPRSEWLPVALPDDLRIVPRELWQRVQRQLTKNAAFSPRNASHPYLLRGLVKCGGCGAAYVGDPCHGKFFYRCERRCKRMPTVKEEHLDGAVWDAVSEAVLNPAMIIDHVSRLHERSTYEEKVGSNESQTVARAIAQLRREEARILEAYRSGIISPTQLGQELELLKQRQGALELRSSALRQSAFAAGNSLIRKTLEEYCQAASTRLQTFDHAERQRFLRLLVETVIFEGTQVRIKAVIPLNRSNQELQAFATQKSEPYRMEHYQTATTESDQIGHYLVPSNNRIEDIVTDSYGRNSVERDDSEYVLSERRTLHDCLNFELCRALPEKPFSILSEEGLGIVRLLKLKQGDPTLRELCDRVHEERGVKVSVTHMSRALRMIGMSPTRRGPRPAELKRAA